MPDGGADSTNLSIMDMRFVEDAFVAERFRDVAVGSVVGVDVGEFGRGDEEGAPNDDCVTAGPELDADADAILEIVSQRDRQMMHVSCVPPEPNCTTLG